MNFSHYPAIKHGSWLWHWPNVETVHGQHLSMEDKRTMVTWPHTLVGSQLDNSDGLCVINNTIYEVITVIYSTHISWITLHYITAYLL